MATYKGIQGYSVQKLTTDPTVTEAVGQLWYNSTTYKFKIATESPGAWASAPSLNDPRDEMASCGTQTAALAAGGEPPNTTNTEIYNGTSWTEVSDLVEGGRYGLVGFGTTTAALACGGYSNPPTNARASVESWNGASWTASTAMSTARYNFGGSKGGTQTAGIVFSGISPSHGTETVNTEEWNGASWTEKANVSTARAAAKGLGVATAALMCGGGTSSLTVKVALVEEYNGTAWTEVGALNTARQNVGSAGTTTAGLVAAGNGPSFSALTEKWNGTAWTEVADVSTARYGPGASGSQSEAAIFGGSTSTAASYFTEEWNDPVYAIKTVTVS